MTITRQMLDIGFCDWFCNKQNKEKSKGEILALLADESDNISSERNL